MKERLEYPYNLIEDLELEPCECFEHFNERLEFLLTKLVITDREEKIIRLYYIDGKTFEEIGKEFGFTRERIRQINEKAIKKLKLFKKYFYGGKWCLMEELAKEEYQKYLETQKSYWKYESAKQYILQYESGVFLPIREQKIENLDLTMRTYNCLKRAGIRTIDDLLNFSYYDLIKIRNLGRKSMKEILDTIHDLGLVLKGEHR